MLQRQHISSRVVLCVRTDCKHQPALKVWWRLLSPLPRVTEGIRYCSSQCSLGSGTSVFWPYAKVPFSLHLEDLSSWSWFCSKEGVKEKQWSDEKAYLYCLWCGHVCMNSWFDLKTSFFLSFLFLTSIREFLTSLFLQSPGQQWQECGNQLSNYIHSGG